MMKRWTFQIYRTASFLRPNFHISSEFVGENILALRPFDDGPSFYLGQELYFVPSEETPAPIIVAVDPRELCLIG
jgi:hypothetical protein